MQMDAHQNAYSQSAACYRSKIALIACVRTLARMHAHVAKKIAAQRTSKVTLITGAAAWKLIRVNTFVMGEIAASCTFIACEWTLTDMPAHAPHEFTWIGASIIAIFAGALTEM